MAMIFTDEESGYGLQGVCYVDTGEDAVKIIEDQAYCEKYGSPSHEFGYVCSVRMVKPSIKDLKTIISSFRFAEKFDKLVRDPDYPGCVRIQYFDVGSTIGFSPYICLDCFDALVDSFKEVNDDSYPFKRQKVKFVVDVWITWVDSTVTIDVKLAVGTQKELDGLCRDWQKPKAKLKFQLKR